MVRVFSMLFAFWGTFVSLPYEAQARHPCYKASFSDGASVRFVDKDCLNRLKRINQKRLRVAKRLAKRNNAKRNNYVLLQGKRKRKRKQVRVRKVKTSRVRRVRTTQIHQKTQFHKPSTRIKRRANKQLIVQLQQLLKQENYQIGAVDGRLGGATKRALQDYKRKHNFKYSASLQALVEHMRQKTVSSIILPIAAPVEAPAIAPVITNKPVIVASLPTQSSSPSPQRGKKYARQCEGCHSFKAGEAHKAGPNLYGVMGQFIGSAQHFNYSESLKFQMRLGNMWNKAEMDCFIKDPQGCKPGTTMSFNGIKSARKRADLIAYLEQLGQ